MEIGKKAGEMEGDLGLKSTSAALKELQDNLKELDRTRNHVQMGNLKFESLCHAIAASVRDAANLMAAGAVEFSAPMRQRSLEARKSLLECATGIVENAGHPFKVCTQLLVFSLSRSLYLNITNWNRYIFSSFSGFLAF